MIRAEVVAELPAGWLAHIPNGVSARTARENYEALRQQGSRLVLITDAEVPVAAFGELRTVLLPPVVYLWMQPFAAFYHRPLAYTRFIRREHEAFLLPHSTLIANVEPTNAPALRFARWFGFAPYATHDGLIALRKDIP